MKKSLCALSLIFSFSAFAQKDDSLQIRKMFDAALVEGHAYNNLRSLCKDVGARLSGSPEAEKAVKWAKTLLESYEFDKVWLMPVKVPHWVRGDIEKAGVNGKLMNIKTLGGSVSSNGKIEAEVIEVQDFDELSELGKEAIKGKIVFFNRAFDRSLISTGDAYGGCVNQRWDGASQASKFGAVGVFVRSLSHKKDNHAHTGSMGYEEGVKKIPSVALSVEDADMLSALLKSEPSFLAYLNVNSQTFPDKDSYNVIAEITGSVEPDKIITFGGHLDSWDVGEGAHDDGAGVVHSIEALRIVKATGYQPRYTLRCVLFMNEENGNNGGKTYAAVAKEKGEVHIAALESDAGGFVPRGFTMDGTPEQVKQMQSWESLLEPYVLHIFKAGWGGVDIKPLKDQNVPLIGLRPDDQRYFDHHHSDSDVFENVHRRELELGAASFASMIYLIDKCGLGENLKPLKRD
ncbi:M20/M25/M40 family metallo-hydrolase [Vicingaceae bacterium]|nr:M20/M25/M40 family metallo-hydrolase [Vicingaceae bacterium]MDC1451231.1 M20/M25/M40 family metallo-hydrolase [Vicingaceae bacterium]